MGPPKISLPPPPPTIDTARQDADQADAFFRRKGQQADLLSTASGRADGGIGTKSILGQG